MGGRGVFFILADIENLGEFPCGLDGGLCPRVEPSVFIKLVKTWFKDVIEE